MMIHERPRQEQASDTSDAMIEQALREDDVFVDLLAQYDDVHGRAEIIRQHGASVPEGLAAQEGILGHQVAEWRGNGRDIYRRVHGDPLAFARGIRILQLEYRIGHHNELDLEDETVAAMQDEIRDLKQAEREWLDQFYPDGSPDDTN